MRPRQRYLMVALLAAVLAVAQGGVPAGAQSERTALYDEGERAQALVAWLSGPGTEGAGIVFQIQDGVAYGVTANHVVYRQGKVIDGLRARFRAWPSQVFGAEATRFDLTNDLAVFQVDLSSLGLPDPELGHGIPLDQLGASADLDPGDELHTVGHATAGTWLSPEQQVRFARGDERNAFLFELDCPRGHSGGGVFDGRWRLVGMMIEEERPFCRALRIEDIFRKLQVWKLDIGLTRPPEEKPAASLADEIVVGVVDFDNRSGERIPDLGSVALDVASSYLMNVNNVVLVSRNRLDTVRREINLQDTERPTGMSRVGKLLDADLLLTGSILLYVTERSVFEGFGTSALKDTHRMTISLQLIDVETGRIRFAKNFETERSKTYPKATSAPRHPLDRAAELLEALLQQAQPDITSALAQVASGLDRAGQFVAVPVTSRPAGAEVILNGAFMGTTPLTLELTMTTHEVALELPRYDSWKRRIEVTPQTTVDVNLVPRKN